MLLFVLQMFCEIFSWNTKNNILPFFLDFNICYSTSCYKDAYNLLSSMNQSVDPCVDFYEFSCGTWSLNHKKPNTEPIWTQWEVIAVKIEEQIQQILESNHQSQLKSINLARQMYQSCVNMENSKSENILKLLKLFDEFGGWPLISNQFNYNNFWLNVVTKLNAKFNIHPLLKFHVSLNIYNTSEYILYIDQPNTIYPNWMLKNSNIYKSSIKAYIQWIMSTALELANNKTNISFNDIKAQSIQIVEFETKLASIIQTNENITSLYKKLTINDLQLWTDLISTEINWIKVINDLFSNYNIKFKNEDYVIINNVVYLLKLIQLIESTDPTIIANYIGWSIAKYFSKDTTTILAKFSFDIDRLLFGNDYEIRSRKHECAISIKKQMNLAIAYEYVNSYINHFSIKDIHKILENMKSVLYSRVKSFYWMDEATKAQALEKVHAITYLISNPDYITNISYIDNYYEELKFTNNNIQNIINWNEFIRRNEFLQLKNTFRNKTWYNEVTDVNAYYSILENSIIIPAGLLQNPFFEPNRLWALNYGAIGTILGHEFSHAFDNTGRQADKKGNIKQWWSVKSLSKYRKIVNCLNEHYSKFIFEIPYSKVHNFLERTQDENIADIIGLKLAFEAYNKNKSKENLKLPFLEKFTSDQLFFISFANQWCESSNEEQILSEIMEGNHMPNKIRILGAISNNEDFNKAFNCEKIAPLYLHKMCSLW